MNSDGVVVSEGAGIAVGAKGGGIINAVLGGGEIASEICAILVID